MSITVGQNDRLRVKLKGLDFKESTAEVSFIFDTLAGRPDSGTCVVTKEIRTWPKEAAISTTRRS